MNSAAETGEARWITSRDRSRSFTVHCIPEMLDLLAPLRSAVQGGRIVDLGCGFGGLSKTIGEFLCASEIYGVDIDEEALDEARCKGVVAFKVDVHVDRLPFDDAFFDLVCSFGVFDYFPTWDWPLREVYRVLRPGGYVCISLPNLGSWHNRLALLLGYQPRDVEVSTEILAGVHPRYVRRGERPVGHIHTVTTKAFIELMNHHGFTAVSIHGLNRYRNIDFPGWVRTLERRLFSSPWLARRFVYIGQRPGF